MSRLITAKQVKDNLNILERISSFFSGDDDYKSAMLQNQMVQTQIMSEMAGVDFQDHMDPTTMDMKDLPLGLVGTAETSISKGDHGRAIFDIGGSKYEARVSAQGDVEENEIVVISSEGNSIRPSDSANGALSVMVGAGEGGRNAVMSPNTVKSYETDEVEEANEIGSVTLEPGEEAVISSTGEGNHSGYLLGIGAYNAQEVEYVLIVDGEYDVGGRTNTPLGTVNDPFWFSDSMGGVVRFTESVEYKAIYPEDSNGQVEITSRMFTQEFV